jgi:GH15 family glucan-1,4-alpha-glucosidase
MLDRLGLIGNCQCSAHVDARGAVVWSCLPRFDSEPLFSTLLDAGGGGHFTIAPADGSVGTQRYIENTNVLETRFESADGAFRVIDFFPRFLQFERSFMPTRLIRIVEPLSGTPRISVHCEPRLGWSKATPRREVGSHHVSYLGYDSELRLTTDVPLSYLGTQSFALTERKHFALTWGQPVEEPLAPLCDRFLRETTAYWQRWVKHCDVPLLYQEQVIRSALVLKLHCFEDTGAIVAALTTSLPESPGSGRTWDYRYCWLRDAYYALGAFRLLGHFEELEQFLHYLLNIAGSAPALDLAPLYRIDGRTDLEETIRTDWAGYLGNGPVRVGNQAAQHRQHDVFGEMVLALTPLFLDARFRDRQTSSALDLVTRLARKAVEVAGQPDAGIWEYRADWRPQTFSSLMCWAAADRMALIAERHQPAMAREFHGYAQRIREEILSMGTDPERGSLVAAYGGKDVDAALLQAARLRFLPADDRRIHATIDAIRRELEHDGWLRRYRTDDGFGVPTVAFVICTFWLIEALATVGRTDEARRVMQCIETVKSPLGLLAEDVEPATGVMWGNFPQAYSHVGMIHAAFAASPPWSTVL